MSTETLNGKSFLEMVSSGAAVLDANRKTVNDLNVFPIPDGDTGDNMEMTIRSGCEAASSSESIGTVASEIARGMLMGARGNSGVILSRIFAGIAKGLEGLDGASVVQLAAAFGKGVEESYRAVSVPVEGTILTVWREAVAAAEGATDIESYFAALVPEMKKSLDNTPELLAVLKEAGVVDSGGAGMLCIAEGMADAVNGKAHSVEAASEKAAAAAVDLDGFGPDSVLEFGYCTEFLLRLQTSKVGDVASFDEGVIKDYLNAVGESVVCFRDGSIVKAHVHTMTPGDILNHVQQWGEFLTLKIENMALQHSGATIQNNFKDPSGEQLIKARRQRLAVVAVASGAGLVQAFKDAGVEEVIEGGQTMNPSSGDFVEAFRRVNAETIIVFPNNSNILLAAQQAAGLYHDSEVIVLPSKNIGSGYVAAASIDRSASDIHEIVDAALATIDSVTTCMVSRAVREADYEGVKVREGEYIGFERSRILTSRQSRNEAAMTVAEAVGLQLHEVAIIFHGSDTPASEAEALAAGLMKKYPRTEIMLTDGGQPVYDYIIVLC